MCRLAAADAPEGVDLFITADFPPAMKLDGVMTPVMDQKPGGQHTMIWCAR
jgi:Tfp pilus assembly ATPase PilU